MRISLLFWVALFPSIVFAQANPRPSMKASETWPKMYGNSQLEQDRYMTMGGMKCLQVGYFCYANKIDDHQACSDRYAVEHADCANMSLAMGAAMRYSSVIATTCSADAEICRKGKKLPVGSQNSKDAKERKRFFEEFLAWMRQDISCITAKKSPCFKDKATLEDAIERMDKVTKKM